MTRGITRRSVLGGGLSFLTGCATPLAGRPRTTRLALLGQSLIKHDVCAQNWPGRAGISARLRGSDVVFSDLEVALRGPNSGVPTRDALTLHTAGAQVIDCLHGLGVNLLATSNNHAFDLNTGGIVDSVTALRARGMAFAGTGMNLTEASRPAVLSTGNGKVALVAAAAGRVREGGMATETRPGVSEIRRHPDGRLDEQDTARMFSAIESAAADGAIVVAYLHNHYWEEPNWVTPQWQRMFARNCVDAGASVFVAHGTPLLQGIETYRGRPLLHGLGSFIFQTVKEDFYDALAWQSVIVECRYEGSHFAGAELIPVQLNPEGDGGAADLETRGRPTLASPADARLILERLALLSDRLGYRLVHDGRRGRIAA